MNLSELVEKIARTFSLSELRELCIRLDIEYEDLSGQNLKEKVIALVNYCKRHRRLEELVEHCEKLRAKESWHFDKSWYSINSLPESSLNKKNPQLNRRFWKIVSVVAIFLIIGSLAILPSLFKSVVDEESNNGLQTPTITSSAPAETTSSTIFTLSNARTEDFYTLNNASYELQSNGDLAIDGSFARGTYVDQALPANFQATIEFRIEHPDDEFILGLSDGVTMRPNYHLVMGLSRTAFKQQLESNVDQWDIPIRRTELVECLIKPNTLYEVVFARKNGRVDISIDNDKCTFSFNTSDVENINEFDFLYLTGALNQQVIIESLILKSLE